MKDFIFKDIKGQLARVGLFVSDTETHDFLMTVAEVNDNIDKFGERPELIKAREALSATCLTDVG